MRKDFTRQKASFHSNKHGSFDLLHVELYSIDLKYLGSISSSSLDLTYESCRERRMPSGKQSYEYYLMVADIDNP